MHPDDVILIVDDREEDVWSESEFMAHHIIESSHKKAVYMLFLGVMTVKLMAMLWIWPASDGRAVLLF